jgi:plastocyanin
MRGSRPYRSLVLGALIVSALGAGCGDDDQDAPPPAGEPAPVAALDFEFDSPELTVEAGTTVKWSNDGATIHNVKGRGFFSRAIDPGAGYEHRFTDPGKYPYLCTLHPATMRGTITVREAKT